MSRLDNYVKDFSEVFGIPMINVKYNGYNYLKKDEHSNTIFAGTHKQCLDFMNGLWAFMNEYKK